MLDMRENSYQAANYINPLIINQQNKSKLFNDNNQPGRRIKISKENTMNLNLVKA